MMTCCHIIGARPQFIKYFPVSRAIEQYNSGAGETGKIKDVLVHTGQHYDYQMSKIFFDEFGIRQPDYHLEAGSGKHGKQTGDILAGAEDVLEEIKPDVVLVYGDTNSTLGGALAAAKLNIPIAHIEAGLRSFNRQMPEEINRIVTDHISDFLFCPSQTAIDNLVREGFENIMTDGCVEKHMESRPVAINSGDVMYDVYLYTRKIAHEKSQILKKYNLEKESIGLLTMHRAENTDDHHVFKQRIEFIREKFEDKTIVFPVHPRTAHLVQHYKQAFGKNVMFIPPVSYFDLILLLEHCDFVLTDSGGLQKEAYWARKPCVTLREETEWIETIETGWNVLMKNYNNIDVTRGKNTSAYGSGNAADNILSSIINYNLLTI